MCINLPHKLCSTTCHFNRPGKTRTRSVKGILALFCYILTFGLVSTTCPILFLWILIVFIQWQILRLGRLWLNQTGKVLCCEQICLMLCSISRKHMCHRQRREEFLTSRAFTIENIPKNIELKLKCIENNFIFTLRYVWYLIR